ncbi:MAG: methylated-DNA--[protein]-cysteine S-methyltransferase [Myxococcaceae bacterium]|nr:methylated-DNA--[protein]-cysteine S-methyltransferase [Myxococcaceae bacterium]MCI0673582.1 methylated-DNA--[protein]-cysteine S-methyltransferase [Myxococcaceae bacterium]
MESPVGSLVLATREDTLCVLSYDTSFDACRGALARSHPQETVEPGETPASVRSELEAYFAGDVAALDRLAVETVGTPFQRDVWAALQRIPVGKMWSYAELALEVGRPSALRAVGAANGQNPVAIVVPCHRVIAADGGIGGYTGGLQRKAWLLEHERRHSHGDVASGGQLELPMR